MSSNGTSARAPRNTRANRNREHGVFIVTHVATGMQFIGTSIDITAERARNPTMLYNGDHSNADLQRLYDKDQRLEMELFVRKSKNDAEHYWAELVTEAMARGTLLNKRVQARLNKLPPKELEHV